MGTRTMGGTQRMDGLLSRQGSLYNLTLDEVQQQLGDLGKPFSSMNLDELLKTVYNAEANHGMSSKQPDYTELPHRGSVSSSELRKKTVDEVWNDIQLGQKMKKNEGDDNGNNSTDNNINEISFKNGDRKKGSTLGEMTLEDFLVKAGVVAESSSEKKNNELSVDVHETPWVNYQMPMVQQQGLVMGGHYPVQQPVMGSGSGSGNVLMDVSYMSPAPLMGSLSDAHMSGRKRFASGDVVEKTVERRQKRMIKNRESAARSRARKQAYTHELENKVSRLEEENERLRRQKELEKVLPCVPPPEPKYQLRRTTSASF
ncbi:ABSCISIC ACID-INSENSITIVE 5-like protein 3 [Rutidosis leptorrhynchoides]|uniref:ABSCISIC ACID-INSENSITIVE 5-like protein 3 n=1 Tax=Rutidosis leptorrhynchoides TaxID=125765 RepID=UPI003A997F1B